MPQGFIVLELNCRGRWTPTGPKEEGDRLAVEGRTAGEDCVLFYAAFCNGLEVSNVYRHCYVPKAAKTGIVWNK